MSEEPAIVDGPNGPEWKPRHGSFTPHTGFDPMDGEDPRVTLARDNPCAPVTPATEPGSSSISRPTRAGWTRRPLPVKRKLYGRKSWAAWFREQAERPVQ